MKAMGIRLLTADDAAAFQALRLRGLLECPTAFASSHEEEVDRPIAATAALLQAGADRAVFGGFADGALVCVAALQRESHRKLSHKAFVWGVYVAPEARRQGMGEALLRQVLTHARTILNVRQVSLGVNTANAPALALYRRLGFETFGTERDYLHVDGEWHDEHLMAIRFESSCSDQQPSQLRKSRREQ